MKNETPNLLNDWREALPEERLAHIVRDVAQAFTRSLILRLERHEVPIGHWTFLRVLWESDGLLQKELSHRAGVMPSTTSIAMRSMEDFGYIVRRRLPDNRKNVYIHLTRKGRDLQAKLVPLAVESNNIGVEGISKVFLEITRNVLLTIIDNLALDEERQQTSGITPTSARRTTTTPTVGKTRLSTL
jgi:DNA-binding MarR family transcriptional regulator